MLCSRIPKYTYVKFSVFYFQANGWAPTVILWSIVHINSSSLSAYVLQGCTSYEMPLSQSYLLKRFVPGTYLLRTYNFTYVDKGCNSHESPLSMFFLPQTQVSRISLCYLEATSVPLGLNSYAPFSNKFLPYVDKGCKSQDSPLSCLLYTSPSPRDRG